MRPSTRLRVVAGAGAALAAVATLPAYASAAHTARAAAPLASAVPSWAAHASPAASEPSSARVDVSLLLRGRDAAGLKQLDAAVSDPASPSYRHFLTRAQYIARYAPTATEVDAARSWLQAAGLTVDATTPNRTLVSAHGSAATVGRAFNTSFARFNVGGRLLRAPLSQPTIPTALRGDVAAVDGLAQTEMKPTASAAPAFVNARPCSAYYGEKTATKQPTYNGKHQPDAICGYTPSQLRSAYGVNKTSLNGKGATVAIVDAYASPTIEQDADTWSSRHGLPKFSSGQFTQVLYPGATEVPEVNPEGLGVVDPQGWAGEETLDVEAVHGMAPKANVIYYAATTVYGPALYLALAQAVEEDKAQVVSNSYGSESDSPLPSDLAVFNQITSEAAAEGITIDYSSGDDGDEVENLGERSADFPATSDQVTAVGGTTLEVDKSGKRVDETYWGTEKVPLTNGKWDFANATFSGAGGGGVSDTYAEPAWQKPVVPNSEATYGGVPAGRVVPDVSMDGDSTTGMLMGQTMTFADGTTKYGEYRIGGTSVSCPLFSGILALAVQSNKGKGLGLITPTLYKDSKTAAGRTALFNDPSPVKSAKGESLLANVRPDFTDTTDPTSSVTYSLRTLGNLGTLHARTGYDDSTGLGTPKTPALVRALG